MVNSEKKSGCFIYFAVFAASLSALATGSCFSWSSPLLPKFQSTDEDMNPIGRPITISESAWIVSTLGLGLVCSPSVSIMCLKYFTKKTVLLLSLGPILTAHVICCFAVNAIVFIFARGLMGLGVGVVWTVLGTYIAEISENKNRGLLGCIPGTMSNLGSLFVYITGPYLNMQAFSFALILPLILFYIAFGFFVPDSPYDLLIKKRQDQAESSLRTLRRRKNIDIELTFMKETITFGCGDEVRLWELLKDRGLRKGLMICVALMTFQQCSCIMVISSYAETIFLLAGSFIPTAISPIILGVVGTMGNLVNLVLVDKLGRKILLSSSCILESITLLILGAYFYLFNSGTDISVISWLPLVSLIVYMIAFNLALGVVPWIVTGEVFHSKVKPLASTITALNSYTWTFILTMCFPYMNQYLGLAWTFWTFSIIMFIGFIFCVIVVPETKGKNFQEIQTMLKK